MAAPSTNYAEITTSLVDIHEADYALFYTTFGADAAQPANATIRDAIIETSNTYPKVFLRVANDLPMISCLLRPTRFTAPMGVISPWANHIFCLNGANSTHGHPSIVEWPADTFSQCAAICTPTSAEVDTLWMADPAAESLGPFIPATPNNEDVQCRYLCPLPTKYAALALQKPQCSPCTFWHEVIHAIQADGNNAACAKLIKWVRMACMLNSLTTREIVSDHMPPNPLNFDSPGLFSVWEKSHNTHLLHTTTTKY